MDITNIFETLEEKLNCRLVYHDVRYQFFHTRRISCQKKYLNLHFRNPDFCPPQEVASCVKHCVVKLRNKLILKKPPYILWRCRKGQVMLAAPVFRNDLLCGILFAGVWKIPLPKKLIRQTAQLMPMLAGGLTEQMEKLISESSSGGFRTDVLDFLENHYQENITLQDMAHKLSLSPSRTCHLISGEFGRPFKVLLRDLRLEKACYMLSHERLNVSEIAAKCAFGSVNYFSAEFRKKFGISPKLYQQQMESKESEYCI